tara:strand:+ start:1014 stop:1250 length:237 start_codon:yes stop_codon:yes gene_type:complete
MPMTADEITRRIQTALPGATIELTDLAGDNDHWQVTVTCASFARKPRVMQHKAVMNAIGKDDMGTTLHALSISTKTPA